ncbi:hypothetical protein [Streptomyces sp. CA-253872]|uniref:hypothetical protein n=1 Tax=Streptomyces sp. CA-253872 TaxID=3240067 RepID=UPI003D909B8B
MTSTPAPAGPDGQPPEELAELVRHSLAYKRAEERLEAARVAIQEAIVRHLRERNARPGRIADHTPYDRVWISELGRNAEPPVPPLKGPRAVGPPPTYDPAVQDAALAELDRLSAAVRRAEATIERERPVIHAEIIRLYELGWTAKTLSPHTPYPPSWVGMIARSGTETRQRPRGARNSG